MAKLISRPGSAPFGAASPKSIREYFRAPGFAFLRDFFSKWLKIDLTTLAVVLTLFGAVSTGTAQVKAFALYVYRWITRFLTASVSIQGYDRLNREVLNWIGANVLMHQETRILTARSEPVQNDAMHFARASDNQIDYISESRLPIHYLPTFGVTWFFHDRNLFLVRRIPEARNDKDGLGGLASDVADQYVMAPAGNEPLVVMCLGRSVRPIKKFLETCREFAEKQRESFITVRVSRRSLGHSPWDATILRPFRPLSTVHMDKTAKDELVADIGNYLAPSTRRFYTNRGIPYRRGYLLHGPPGTGKTTLSLALAGRFGLELYIVHVPSLWGDCELERLFTALPPQCLVLLEDIDAVGIKRQLDAEDEEETPKPASRPPRLLHKGTGKITLSGLLNVLDGVASQEGRVVFITSNIADQLDETLIRPGRIDKMVFLGNICQEAANEMFLRWYSSDDSTESPNLAEPCADGLDQKLMKFANEFSSRVPNDIFSPAQLQSFLLQYRDEPAAAVEAISNWVHKEQDSMEESRLREEEHVRRKTVRRKARNEFDA